MMRIRFGLLVSTLICFSTYIHSQTWSGIVDPSRAIDWSQAGVQGGIPSGSWTQCGSTVGAYSGSASTINSAIASCGANQYVLLGAGTFNLSSGIDFGGKSNVAVRGQGADTTNVVFTGQAACNGVGANVCLAGSNNSAGGEQNVCDWTAGYSLGTTVITLSNCGHTTPAVGSLSNLAVGSLLTLDQVDDTGDKGQVRNCLVTDSCSNGGSGGGARTDGTCVSSMCNRSQQQEVTVTKISGSTITISPGLYMPNWNGAQDPQAWFANQYIALDGVENLSINNSASSANYGLFLMNCHQCWVKGVRSLVAKRAHVGLGGCVHCNVQDSYFYQNQSHSSVSYGLELSWGSSDNLIQNNICQQITDGCPNSTAGAEGNVAAYNFAVDDTYSAPGWMQPPFYQHASGDSFWLWEGNIGSGYIADNVHGTHHFNSLFRNRLTGFEVSCDGSPCSAQMDAVQIYASSRFFNIVGNVLGETNVQNNYACTATGSSGCSQGNTSIYTVGYTGNGGSVNSSVTGFSSDCGSSSGKNDYDKCTTTGLLRWGNYDTVNGSDQFNTSEVPTGLSQFATAVPSGHSLPASFYLSGKPSWWQSEPWPSAGPDVSGGNLGICSGGKYSGAIATNSSQCIGGTLVADVAGQAGSIPAMDCYLNAMSGPPDGSGGALVFNANNCYNTSPPPQAPTGLTVTVH